jgi:hypothetical protein
MNHVPVTPLYCTVCHTKWTEACLRPRDPCPFVDCVGLLTYTPPPTSTRPVRGVRDRTLPLFEGIE